MRNVTVVIVGILLLPGLSRSADDVTNVVGEIVKVEANRQLCGGMSGTRIVVKVKNGGMTAFFVIPTTVVTGALIVGKSISASVKEDKIQDSEVAIWVKTTDK